MPDVKVSPAHLDALADYLKHAQDKLDAGFKAPRSVGKYPDKLSQTHGLTSTAGERAVMNAIDGPRAAVQEQMKAAITSCIEALKKAKTSYLATDQGHSDVLNRQINT